MNKASEGLPYISIVGRPNVGKSSLYNALTKSRKQITHGSAGTTRDRQEAIVVFKDKQYVLADTGGLLHVDRDDMDQHIYDQINESLSQASVVLLVCDITEGLREEDKEIARFIRTFASRVVVVCNKADTAKIAQNSVEFYELGFEDIYTVSALHRIGLKALQEHICTLIAQTESTPLGHIRIAIAGKPNVGKSSIVNKLLNKKRVIVCDEPGTTRDSVDTYIQYKKRHFILTDTAGIRSKKKVKNAIGQYSLMRSFDAIKSSAIVFVVIDPTLGLARDDRKIIDFAYRNGKCACIVVNKWDCIKNVEMHTYADYIRKTLREGKNAPILFTSATTGRNIEKILEEASELYDRSNMKIASNALNKLVPLINSRITRKKGSKKICKVYYLLQSGRLPMKFLVTVNSTRIMDGSTERLIENAIRTAFNLKGVSFFIDYRV